MGLIGIVSVFVALILIGIGIAVGLVACGLLAGLVALGVVSTSFIVGIRNGRAADGIRLFLLLCGLIAGVPAGAVCSLLAQSLFVAVGNGDADWLILIYGGLGGAFAGILVALSLDAISRRLHAWASERLQSALGSLASEPDS